LSSHFSIDPASPVLYFSALWSETIPQNLTRSRLSPLPIRSATRMARLPLRPKSLPARAFNP
jgi:hypothetical protein